jgi:hypothetical protein
MYKGSANLIFERVTFSVLVLALSRRVATKAKMQKTQAIAHCATVEIKASPLVTEIRTSLSKLDTW